AEDVLVTAEFEDMPVLLDAISVTTPPDKIEYVVGDTLDLSGIVVTASYTDETTKEVTSYKATPDTGTALETEGPQTITISYTEGEITKETTFTVQVTAAPGGGE
ncbi:MAG: hypothetical protein GX847_09130, partial [Clostridiales bacterium]|nr:hypothetical protein [Clostridiales bacterium]